MKVLCDENLPASLAGELRAVGFDAIDVRERGLGGASDDTILALATTEDRVIVTMDVRRFANLVATPPRGTPGIVVARMPSLRARTVCDRLRSFLLGADPTLLRDTLTIVEPATIRRRR